uniref:Uncharacterized protein n=1 Tax=Rhizophora mucronata TaxID=61149 RepID=A0A2P2Q9X2_RHIMU
MSFEFRIERIWVLLGLEKDLEVKFGFLESEKMWGERELGIMVGLR